MKVAVQVTEYKALTLLISACYHVVVSVLLTMVQFYKFGPEVGIQFAHISLM